ncbi:hypothetical protein C5167_030970 [Papaver somniferum]|nr:hypothetical protein C5167_030970 [Papaver somniferum]
MDSSQDGVRRSPRLIELRDREKQLWSAQNKSKQEKITGQQKQEFDERRRLAYQKRKTRINEASTSSSVQFSNSAGGFIPRRSPRFIGCGNTDESLDKASVQVSNSAGVIIPRRSPRFIGRGNTAGLLNEVQRRDISEEYLADEQERKRVRERTRRLNMTEEQRSIERERNRVRERTRRQDMTEGQRLIERERDRNRYLAAKDKMNLPSSIASNTSPSLFEHVMHEHVQAEVEILIGRISTVVMNTSEGYMELGLNTELPYIQHLTICSSLMSKSTIQETIWMRVTKRICKKGNCTILNLINETTVKDNL